jgi:hypothetical protein
VLLHGKQHPNISIGTRYRRRDAPYIVWEVIAQYAGVDGLRYIVLRNLSDRTWQKTLSQIELDRGDRYTRVRAATKMPLTGG